MREGNMWDFVQRVKENLARDGGYPANRDVYEAKDKLMEAMLRHWYFDDLRKWTWWLSLVLTIIPLIIWWKIVDRKRLLEITVYGLLANITATFLDVIGSELVLWSYPDRLLPNLPRLLPIDYVVVPVAYMLIYQYFPKWKDFVIAMTVLSLIFSFVAEPLLVLLNMYELHYWQYWYSLPIYFAIGVVLRIFLEALLRQQIKE